MGKKNLQFGKYYKLRSEIDRAAAGLETLHKKHMQCKKGCDLCCMDYSIFPVEYYSILNELKIDRINIELNRNESDGSCVFLKNKICTIYLQRPVICRTHGLPLLFTNNDGEFELSACELNFTEFDNEDYTALNTLAQDTFNSRLFMLNKAFIGSFGDKKYGEFDLIPLKEITREKLNLI